MQGNAGEGAGRSGNSADGADAAGDMVWFDEAQEERAGRRRSGKANGASAAEEKLAAAEGVPAAAAEGVPAAAEGVPAAAEGVPAAADDGSWSDAVATTATSSTGMTLGAALALFVVFLYMRKRRRMPSGSRRLQRFS